jgi:hypothetical protein
MGVLNDCAVGYCGYMWPLMPKRKEICAGRECSKRFEPTRKGCDGRQKVQAEYVRYAKELLKDGAAEGDWICVTCRDTLKARASTFGVAVGDDAQVPVCAMLLQCNSNELNGAVHHKGVGSRTTT